MASLYEILRGRSADEKEQAAAEILEPDGGALYARMKRDRDRVLPTNSYLHSLASALDNLYFPTTRTTGGADHWPEHAYANPGKVHISLNVYPVYVDIPATLIAARPIERIVPRDETDKYSRTAADAVEALYRAWATANDIELQDHIACLVRALYGWTYAKVFWDDVAKIPRFTVLEQPQNLYVGWGASDYTRMDYAIYHYTLSPLAVADEFGVDVVAIEDGDSRFPLVIPKGTSRDDPLSQKAVSYQRLPVAEATKDHVSVYDYWYREGGVTKNAIFAGGRLVHAEDHPELGNELPYIILPNAVVPGWPYGRSELHDLEQLIREKEERLSEMGQMIHIAVEGQRWQLVGPDAPTEIDDDMIPGPNRIATPGPGSRIEPIQPFIPELQAQDYLARLDREIEVISGLNDVLLGRAPLASLGSSRAIAALMAQYAARIELRRKLFYAWRKRRWELSAAIWAAKDARVKKTIDDGGIELQQVAPDLTPRDRIEAASMAMNLVNARLWSMERAMGETGVDNTTSEKDLIREEQSDAALQPASAQAQLQLLIMARQLGVDITGAESGPGSLYAAANQFTAQPRSETLSQPENQPPEGGQAAQFLAQTQLAQGQIKGRILSQQQVPVNPEEQAK
jgi:hypothetical protein